MNKWTLPLVALCSFVTAQAAEYSATGTVQKIIALDHVANSPVDRSHILITGFASAGSCGINDGLVALILRNDEGGRRQAAVALTAKSMNRPVTVRADDAFKNSLSACYLKYIELN